MQIVNAYFVLCAGVVGYMIGRWVTTARYEELLTKKREADKADEWRREYE